MAVPNQPLLIVNPASGRAVGDGRWVHRVIGALHDAGAKRVEARVTETLADAERWAGAAADDGHDLLLIAGGDGTVAAAAHGVVQGGHDLPIGIIPIGTGNGLARHLRLPEDPLAAARVSIEGCTVRLDAIDVVSHGRTALVFVGAGLDAEINRDANSPTKRRLGRFAYVVAGAQRIVGRRNHRVLLTIDGHAEPLLAHAISVINAGRFELAGLDLGPPGDPRDGRLEVAVFRRPGPLQVAGQVVRLLAGRPTRTELIHATEVHLACDPPMPVHIDGDISGETPLRVRVVPGAMRFVAGREFVDPQRERASAR